MKGRRRAASGKSAMIEGHTPVVSLLAVARLKNRFYAVDRRDLTKSGRECLALIHSSFNRELPNFAVLSPTGS